MRGREAGAGTRRAVRVAGGAFAVALAGTWLTPVPAHADIVRDRQKPILNVLGMDAAWKVTKGKGVTVAVVDSGVDATQADLTGSVTTGPNMIAEIDGTTKPARLHGTGMASLIAGHGHGPGRGSGVIGIAPESRVLAIRAIAEPEDRSFARYRRSERADTAIARGVRYAADHGADVINLSLGKKNEVAEERAAIAYAIQKGVVVVSAAGNDGDDPDEIDGDGYAPYSYPASYPGVIAVAATEPGHARAPFSNRNYSVVLSAPGMDVPVAAPGGQYFASRGTSDSTALVSGIAALIRARHPDLSPALVSQALIQSTRHRPSGGYDSEVGFGEVHAARALSAADALAEASATRDKPAGQRFGKNDPGPVQIIPRPAWVRPLIIGLVLLGLGGTVTAGAIALAFRRRHPRVAGGPPVGPTGPMGPMGPMGPPPGPPTGGHRSGPPPLPPRTGPPPSGPPPLGSGRSPMFGPPDAPS
ncbi:type VII secretion-associated serine protease mycosin [Actinomadura pelletieri DSM 43383]|uniref:Type VII secretion-associated serine protease mycosin n=1 Tax=Actinomadura pelletieri DSM 43383 TaxID=1120940 RepID=A0A495QI38_9ACTN|nr:S8 family serine peptidase [Actinomadura pelletieri]RKS71817.1 type VII secretion-associated serine protease mycosin [Actinomadura pelletieri DSM 43383]